MINLISSCSEKVNNEVSSEIGSETSSVINSDIDVIEERYIIGEAEVTIKQAETFLHQINIDAPYYAEVYKEEASIEGVRWDVAFAQSILETNYFRFGNSVKANQNNFAGLGATDDGSSGLAFTTPMLGIRAQIQHLKAYASTLPLVQECVDVRFKYVTRGSAPRVKDLGNGKWASDKNYGSKINNILGRISQVKV